jgi:hypothetical protein
MAADTTCCGVPTPSFTRYSPPPCTSGASTAALPRPSASSPTTAGRSRLRCTAARRRSSWSVRFAAARASARASSRWSDCGSRLPPAVAGRSTGSSWRRRWCQVTRRCCHARYRRSCAACGSLVDIEIYGLSKRKVPICVGSERRCFKDELVAGG